MASPTSQTLPGLASITERQYHPLLSMLQRPDLVATQGFIGGKWVEARSEDHFIVTDPATEEEVASVANMGADETRDAIAAAKTAQPQWKKTTSSMRAELLKKWAAAVKDNAKDLALIGSIASGKPLSVSKWEIEFVVEAMEYFAHEVVRSRCFVLSPSDSTQQVIVTKEPVGVCGIITPWNFPYAVLGLNLAPPLAAGCVTVVKPAGESSLSVIALAKLSEEVSFPRGVVNVVTASRENSEEVDRVLTSSEDVRKISFVGSTEVGKWFMKQSSSTMKRLGLRLGGNAPFIVFEDADLKQALDGLMKTKFKNSGQACIATNRVLVHESIYDKFTAKLVDLVKLLKIGLPLEHGVQLGPLIGPSAVKKVAELVEDAVQHGAKVLVGGKVCDLGSNFFEATVLTNVNESMCVWREEIFGPVVPLFSFSSEEDVVRKANDTPMGLAAYFYTQDVARMFRVAGALESGMIGVNSEIVTHAGAPFGGVKESGIDREGSLEGLEEFQESKMVCIEGL